jgi:GT2 family glycosyltransferase
MDLSVCILTHNQPELLPKCITSCIAEIGRSGISGEVIIVDNASEDSYPDKSRSLSPLVRVLRNEENVGFSAANNQAIRSSSGENVLILNDDAMLEPESLRMMIRALESDVKAGAVGPLLVNPDGSAQRGYTNRRFPNIRGSLCPLLHLDRLFERTAFTRDLLTLSKDLERTGEAEHLAGACLLAKRKALNDVGLFDEGFYYLYEDADLCYRLKTAGWRILYLAEARVVHHGSASFKRTIRSERDTIVLTSLMYFFKKHSFAGRYFILKLCLTLVVGLRVPAAALLAAFQRHLTRQERWDLMRSSLKALRLVALEAPGTMRIRSRSGFHV